MKGKAWNRLEEGSMVRQYLTVEMNTGEMGRKGEGENECIIK